MHNQVRHIAAGDRHTAVVDISGTSWMTIAPTDWWSPHTGPAAPLIGLAHSTETVSCGNWHTVVLTDDQRVYVNDWGTLRPYRTEPDDNNMLELDDRSPYTYPPGKAVAVAAGATRTWLISPDHTIWTAEIPPAYRVGSDRRGFRRCDARPAHTISAGPYHTLCIHTDGTVGVAHTPPQGPRRHHQPDEHTSSSDPTPTSDQAHDHGGAQLTFTAIPTITGARHISSGFHHSVIVDADNTLWRYAPRLPIAQTAATPVEGIRVRTAAAGRDHTVAVDTDGQLWVAGCNDNGQLGLPDRQRRLALTRAPIDTPIVAVSAGGYHSTAIDTEGRIWVAGSNSDNQLGYAGASPPGWMRLPTGDAYTIFARLCADDPFNTTAEQVVNLAHAAELLA